MKSCNGSDEGNEKKGMASKPKIFIGSSSEGKKIAEAAKKLIEKDEKSDDKDIDIEVKIWDKIFRIGETYIERLLKALEEFDFAVLVITADDSLVRGETTLSTMRDNVLFELGLFMGRLGRHRAIMLYDEGQIAKLPSDLGGIHKATFSTTENMTDEELEKALKNPCKEIRDYILYPYEDEITAYEVWKKSCHEIYEAIKKAPEDATIRIIQTWLPDLEEFIEDLEILLTAPEYDKRFKFQILLIDYDPCDDDNHRDLLGARIKYRREKRKNAIKKIEDSISQFENLKKSVEEKWRKTGNKDKTSDLDLKIQLYDFLPFGPFYQIGDDMMFVGFYLNHCSSVNAPMLKIHKTARILWRRFEKHFEIGWENSRVVYPPPETKRKNRKPCPKCS